MGVGGGKGGTSVWWAQLHLNCNVVRLCLNVYVGACAFACVCELVRVRLCVHVCAHKGRRT